jgi:hypothetical protein
VWGCWRAIQKETLVLAMRDEVKNPTMAPVPVCFFDVHGSLVSEPAPPFIVVAVGVDSDNVDKDSYFSISADGRELFAGPVWSGVVRGWVGMLLPYCVQHGVRASATEDVTGVRIRICPVPETK